MLLLWFLIIQFLFLGGDDGFLHIWDLRRFQQKTPVATFKHHTQPVTTVEWHPTDSAVFSSGGSDNQIALWDLSVEKDDETDSNEEIEVSFSFNDNPLYRLFLGNPTSTFIHSPRTK